MWRAAAVVRPDIVVLTSVAGEHAENFLSLEATAKEKERLVGSLSPQGRSTQLGRAQWGMVDALAVPSQVASDKSHSGRDSF